MATITNLPDDVIIIILGRMSISFEDIANFQSTCKRLQQITLSNKFWERKYYQSNASIRCNTEFFYLCLNPHLSYPSNVIMELYPNNVFSSATVNLFSHISVTHFIMKNYHFYLKYYQKYCRDFNIIFILLYRYFAVDKPINIENIYEMIIDTIKINSDKVKKSVKRRTKEVKFAVGMIVRHTWKNHLFNGHDGVIIGWHNKCDAMFLNNVKRPPLLSFLQCFEFNHLRM
ncbi:uncharacterized protein LOC126855606 [Cataglyphis hispanica]|uniref:uncharacterized protein LOC126855606 n=1 Tax=Cataglyphis hispanica TaxID=1086592 RepID=UPI00217FF258|nr:uncharacterized protein LOC126855606 [Cataglyphis hispanica]